MTFVEDDNVIQKLSPQAADQAFNIGVLPRRGRRRDDFIDTQRLKLSANPITVDAVTVS